MDTGKRVAEQPYRGGGSGSLKRQLQDLERRANLLTAQLRTVDRADAVKVDRLLDELGAILRARNELRVFREG